MSAQEDAECPTCGDVFSSEHGMKVHHSRAHGESIAGTTVKCEYCGSEFDQMPSRANNGDKNYCSQECLIKDRSYSKDELIDELLRLRDELGHPPSQDDLVEFGKHSRKPYIRKFDGGWNAALRAAGMEPHREHQSKEDCLEDIRAVAEQVGGVPTTTQQREHGGVSLSHISRTFESWKEAVSKAGLDVSKIRDYDIPRESILSDIESVAEKLDRVPTKNDIDRHGDYCSTTARRKFGTFSQALQEAGLEPHRKQAIEVCCSNCEGTIKRYVYFVERSDNLFCDEECFFAWLREGNAPSGEEHHQYDPDSPDNAEYGPSWPEQRRRARQRDNHTCCRCGMSSEEHKQKYGMELHVHHIKPWHKFDDHTERNKLSNLMTLCASCHKTWEDIPIEPQITVADGGESA